MLGLGCLGCCENASTSLLTFVLGVWITTRFLDSAAATGHSRAAVCGQLFVLAICSLFAILLLSSDTRSFMFSRLCSALSRNTLLDSRRCAHLAAAHGRVLELGPGTGVNFRCFSGQQFTPNITELHLVEPNRFFQVELEANIAKSALAFPVTIHYDGIESFGLPRHDYDESFDVIYGTHVLCSVRSISLALKAIARLLKRHGKYLVFEHVLGKTDQWLLRTLQVLFQPLFYIVGAGCTFRDLSISLRLILPDYETRLEHWQAPMPIPLLKPHTIGSFTKP